MVATLIRFSKELESAQSRVSEMELQSSEAASSLTAVRDQLDIKAKSLDQAHDDLATTRDKCVGVRFRS